MPGWKKDIIKSGVWRDQSDRDKKPAAGQTAQASGEFGQPYGSQPGHHKKALTSPQAGSQQQQGVNWDREVDQVFKEEFARFSS